MGLLLFVQVNDDSAAVHHNGAVAGGQCRGHIVGDHHGGETVFLHDAVGKLQHLGSSLRVQLAAVVAVCLVAVVLGWVMAGGDNDAGAAMQLTNGKGQGRGRHQFLEEISLDPVCSKDAGGHTGKQVALDAAVISDGNRWIFIFFVDIIRHALGSQSNGVDVHAVGAYAKDAAQTGGAEFQHFYKAFFNLIVVSFDVDHFCNQVRVLQLL